jgi:hypothetical protein
MGNVATGLPGPCHGTVSGFPALWSGGEVANKSVLQIPHPLLSIRQETQGQQSVRLVRDRRVAETSGGKGLIIEEGGTAFACRACLLKMSKFFSA